MSGVEPSTLQTMSQHHVLFVGGILSGLDYPRLFYFTDNEASVNQELNSTSSFFAPYTTWSIADNLESIYDRIIEEYEKSKKPLYIVAHSKGAVEVYATLLKYPQLILHHVVEGAILIQAAIGGSPLAHSHNCGFFIRGVHLILGSGPPSLTPDQRKVDTDLLLDQMKDTLASLYGQRNPGDLENLKALISKKILFAPSYEKTKKLCGGLQWFRWFCNADEHLIGKSDGLLLLADQISNHFGISLEPVHADHTGLVTTFPNRLTSHDRKAYTRALFQRAITVLKSQ